MIDANEPGQENSRFRRMGTGRQRLLLLILGPLAVLAVAAYLYFSGGRYVSTDDAYVKADKISISADVGARVVEVDVARQPAGPSRRRAVQARRQSLPHRAGTRPGRSRRGQAPDRRPQATYRQKQADLKSAQDTLPTARSEFDRQQQMLAGHVTSQAKFDQASNNLDVARQQLDADQQQLANVLASLGGNPDIETDQHPLVQQAQAQVDQAALDLSHTVVTAPADGIVTKVEQSAGGRLPQRRRCRPSRWSRPRNVWIEANFKETDLTHMRPGRRRRSTSTPIPAATFNAHVAIASAPAPARSSRCCRRRTPPATGSRWCSACRCACIIDDPDPAPPAARRHERRRRGRHPLPPAGCWSRSTPCSPRWTASAGRQ